MSQVKEAKKLFFKALDADEKNQAAAFDLYLGMGLYLLWLRKSNENMKLNKFNLEVHLGVVAMAEFNTGDRYHIADPLSLNLPISSKKNLRNFKIFS